MNYSNFVCMAICVRFRIYFTLAGHIRSNPPIYLVSNSVALSGVLYINFTKDFKAAILDLQMECKGTNYPLTLLHSNISRIPNILSLRHNKRVNQSGNIPSELRHFLLHHECDFG